jgi:hypothetical protein
MKDGLAQDVLTLLVGTSWRRLARVRGERSGRYFAVGKGASTIFDAQSILMAKSVSHLSIFVTFEIARQKHFWAGTNTLLRPFDCLYDIRVHRPPLRRLSVISRTYVGRRYSRHCDDSCPILQKKQQHHRSYTASPRTASIPIRLCPRIFAWCRRQNAIFVARCATRSVRLLRDFRTISSKCWIPGSMERKDC